MSKSTYCGNAGNDGDPNKHGPVLVVTSLGDFKLNPDLTPDKVLHYFVIGYLCGILSCAGIVQFIDYHKVLSLYDPDEKTPFQDLESTRVCISYVGKLDGRRSVTVMNQMRNRIKSGQIAFGIVCTVRGEKKKRKYDPCTAPGSKAGIISVLVKFASQAKLLLFFDDSKDHCVSVNKLKAREIYVEVCQVFGKATVVSFLRKKLTNV